MTLRSDAMLPDADKNPRGTAVEPRESPPAPPPSPPGSTSGPALNPLTGRPFGPADGDRSAG